MEMDSTTPSYVQPALRALYKDENVKRCGAQLAVASNEEECYVTAAYDSNDEELVPLAPDATPQQRRKSREQQRRRTYLLHSCIA